MNSKHAAFIIKHGVSKALAAAELAREGEGGSTVGIYLGLHFKTACALTNAGLFLPTITKWGLGGY